MWQSRRAFNIAALAFGAIGVAAGMFAPNASVVQKPKLTYSRDVLPILSDKCFKCHGPDPGSRMADMRLDTAEGAFANRNGTIPIVPRHPEHSLVIKRITSTSMPMPPPLSGKTLSKGEIATITQWIAEGAKYGKLWSFEPLPSSVTVPVVKGTWAKDDIDKFILAKLNESHLHPTAPASRDRWLRRVTYDLTGLPPTTGEVRSFEKDLSPKAFEKVVDRLLGSSHFGERMAVDWLDAARYSDSYGYQSDLISPTWPYRDWVVRAFNQNKPYDQFLIEQLAGDLLPNATRDQKLATAFNRLHRQSNEGGSIPLEYRTEYAADRLSTYGTAVLGLTIGCARCHDHKFDPITQKEYYQLTSYFNVNEFGLLLSSEIVPTPSMLLPTKEQDKELGELRRKSEDAEKDLAFAKRSTGGFQSWLTQHDARPQIPDLVAQFTFGQAKDGKFVNQTGGKATAEKFGTIELVKGPSSVPNSRAAEMDGENAVIVRGLPAKDRWEPFTWSFWIQDPRTAKTPEILLHRTGGTDVGFCGLDLTLDSGYLIARVMRAAPGNSITICTKSPVPQGHWTHVAWSWDGTGKASGLKLYVDGKDAPCDVVNDKLWKKVNAYGDLGPSGGDWCFGQRFRDLGFKGGQLAEIAFASRALSRLEVAQLFDGHSLSSHLAANEPTDLALREYYESAVDPVSRKALAGVQKAQQELTNFEEKILEIPVMEQPKPSIPSYLLARGAYDAPRNAKTLVSCGVPKVLPPLKVEASQNNRLALARWTVQSDNPLTSRVAVNRYWQLFFGTGIVESTENFGVQGSRPSHPELLDYLALKFMRSGWNLKALMKEIVLSATYRQDSARTTDLDKVDPYNRLLARGPSFRLPAEMLRDTVLAASGLLVDELGGPPVNPYQPAGIWTENNTMTPGFVQSKGPGLYRRSLYSTWKRTTPVPSMLLFDATSREACTVKRPTTNTPLQSLVLLNDIQFVEAARVLAQNVLAQTGPDDQMVRTIFQRLCSRDPNRREQAILLKTYQEQRSQFQADPVSAAKLVHMGDTKPPQNANYIQLAALAITAQMVMNSDAVVWRR